MPSAEKNNLAIRKGVSFTTGNFYHSFSYVNGLRAFEMHPGRKVAGEILSHGLHVHAVIDRYVPVDIVRKIWEREGKGGRLHVKKIPRERAMYIGKYLAKQRVECLRRRRLWAAFGSCESSKCKDIVVDSRWTATYQFLAGAIQGFKKLRYDERARIVTHFCAGQSFEKALESIGMRRRHDGEELLNEKEDTPL